MAIADASPAIPGQKKKVQWNNIALGGIMNLFEVRHVARSAAWGEEEGSGGFDIARRGRRAELM